jgi:hypothetical protein
MLGRVCERPRPEWAKDLAPGSGNAEYLRRIGDYRRATADARHSDYGGWYAPTIHEQVDHLATYFERALAGRYAYLREGK